MGTNKELSTIPNIPMAVIKKLNIEIQICVRWNHAASTLRAVTHVGGHMQDTALAKAHLHHTIVPTRNNLSHANRKLEGLTTVARGVELGAVCNKRACIVHGKLVAWLGESLPITGLAD